MTYTQPSKSIQVTNHSTRPFAEDEDCKKKDRANDDADDSANSNGNQQTCMHNILCNNNTYVEMTSYYKTTHTPGTTEARQQRNASNGSSVGLQLM